MAFPLLGLAAGAATGAALRYGPHIFRYLYPRVAPKMVTGAKRLGQLMKQGLKNPVVIGGAIGSGLEKNILGININKAHAPSNPYLQNMLNPYGPFMPYTAPRTEMPLGVGNHPPMPNALEDAPQELKPHVNEQMQSQTQPLAPVSPTPPPEPTDLDKYLQSNTYKFFQSDAYEKLKDLFAGMAAAPSGGSGWDALASGVQHLNKGDKERKQVNQTVEYLKAQGMSEEEARFMAGNKAALNAFWGQKVNDGNGLSSKEELDRQRQMIELKNSEVIRSNMLDDIKIFMDYVKKDPDWSTGNLASVQAYVGVPEHRDMKSLLDSIKGRIGIDRLETMRQYSRNGASGLGNLTEKELDILQSYLGSLDYRLGGKELLRRLKAIDNILRKMKSNVLSLLESKTIQLTEENVRKVTSGQDSKTQQEGNKLPVAIDTGDIKNLRVGDTAIVHYGDDSYEIIKDR